VLTIVDDEWVDCGHSSSEESGKLEHLHGRGTLAVWREDKGVWLRQRGQGDRASCLVERGCVK
jgi:hypothetical protein